MAIRLQDKQNVTAPDSDYPFGNIKDDTGAGDGTPVNVQVYADFHQFFAKMFALSGLTYNGLPDNEYSGFQYIEAATKLWKTFDGVKLISVDTTLTAADKSKLIVVSGSVAGIIVSLPSSTTLEDGDDFNIMNNSDYSVTIARAVPDAIQFNGNSAVTLVLPYARDFVKLALDKSNTDWYVANYQITKDTKISQQITLSSQTTASGSYVDLTGLTYTNTSGASKKFRFSLKGDADLAGTGGLNSSIAQSFFRIYNDTTATELDEVQRTTAVYIPGPANDVAAVLSIGSECIETIASGDVVKCQFKLSAGDGVTATKVKFLIEELES